MYTFVSGNFMLNLLYLLELHIINNNWLYIRWNNKKSILKVNCPLIIFFTSFKINCVHRKGERPEKLCGSICLTISIVILEYFHISIPHQKFLNLSQTQRPFKQKTGFKKKSVNYLNTQVAIKKCLHIFCAVGHCRSIHH